MIFDDFSMKIHDFCIQIRSCKNQHAGAALCKNQAKIDYFRSSGCDAEIIIFSYFFYGFWYCNTDISLRNSKIDHDFSMIKTCGRLPCGRRRQSGGDGSRRRRGPQQENRKSRKNREIAKSRIFYPGDEAATS